MYTRPYLMSRNNIFAPGEFYHVYNRGVEKRKIFCTKTDYERFIALLFLCNSRARVHMADIIPRGLTSWNLQGITELFERGEELVDIGAYCLMPNHFHLIIREKSEKGLSLFMQKVTTGYTMYFNTLNKRTGALLQGTFKSTHVENDRYLKYLISYLHLNPIKLIEPQWKENGIKNKKKAESFLKRYRYSSYVDYAGEDRMEKCVLNTDSLPKYFETLKHFKTNVAEWLSYPRDVHEV